MFFFLKNDLRLENFGSKLPCSHFLQKRMKYFVTKFKTISCTKSEWSPLKLVDFCWTAGRIRPLQFITFFFNFLFLLIFHNLRSFWYFSELCGPVVKAIGFRLIVSSNPYLAIFFSQKAQKKWWIGGVEFCKLSSKSQPTLIQISRGWAIFWQKVGFTQNWIKTFFLTCFGNFPTFNNLSFFKKKNLPFRSNLWWILGQKEGWKIFAPSTLIRDMYKHNL